MSQLFKAINSRSYTQEIVRQAARDGWIERTQGGKVLAKDVEPEDIQLAGKPVYCRLTEAGRQLLKSQLPQPE
jgi:hypothetical protein